MKTVTVRLGDDEYKWLKERAKAEKTNVEQFVLQRLISYLDAAGRHAVAYIESRRQQNTNLELLDDLRGDSAQQYRQGALLNALEGQKVWDTMWAALDDATREACMEVWRRRASSADHFEMLHRKPAEGVTTDEQGAEA